jgi:hypothetical protein
MDDDPALQMELDTEEFVRVLRSLDPNNFYPMPVSIKLVLICNFSELIPLEGVI